MAAHDVLKFDDLNKTDYVKNDEFTRVAERRLNAIDKDRSEHQNTTLVTIHDNEPVLSSGSNYFISTPEPSMLM